MPRNARETQLFSPAQSPLNVFTPVNAVRITVRVMSEPYTELNCCACFAGKHNFVIGA